MKEIEELIANNHASSANISQEDPEFFERLACAQSPVSYGLVALTAAFPPNA